MQSDDTTRAKPSELLVNGEVWRYDGPAGWYFIRLSDADAAFVDDLDGVEIVGLGYVKVTARLGETEWQTTLFPEKDGGYLLAIKAAVRRQEAVVEGERVEITLSFY